MPSALTFPGVYIEEIPSGVRTITGVATSITAFVGYAIRGPVNKPTTVQSFPEFARRFGGLSTSSTMSYAVQQYFLNGGRDALIVRVVHLGGGGTTAKKGRLSVGGTGTKELIVEAASEGEWADGLRVRIDHDTSPVGPANLFNLSIKDVVTGVVETFRNLPPNASIIALVEQQSSLVRIAKAPTARPDDHSPVLPGQDPFDPAVGSRFDAFPATGTGSGVDGDQADLDLVPATDDGTGLYALAKADLFNLLCIPPFMSASSTDPGRVLEATAKGRAAAFCEDHRAFFIVDPHPDWDEPSDLTTASATDLTTYITGIGSDDRKNAAIYFPYLRSLDPLQGNAPGDFPPSGAVAGVMARTDATRGVWKAPAGLDAGVSGVLELKAKFTDGQNGIVNPLGVNCLRTFPTSGTVVWGSRTLAGADAQASEWKYVPVRRTALFLEESLYRGTQWVVFEPNDAPLWAQIRLNVGAFLNVLFRQGAFAGTTPREAYFVKCDAETTTQDDVNLGIVNIVVGFAPLKPAEFVVIKLQQMAGQTGSA